MENREEVTSTDGGSMLNSSTEPLNNHPVAPPHMPDVLPRKPTVTMSIPPHELTKKEPIPKEPTVVEDPGGIQRVRKSD